LRDPPLSKEEKSTNLQACPAADHLQKEEWPEKKKGEKWDTTPSCFGQRSRKDSL